MYILSSFILDQLTLHFFTTISDKLNLLQTILFVILETTLFATYLTLTTRNRLYKKIILVGLSLFIAFSIVRLSFVNISNETYTAVASLETIIIIISCILVLFEQINNPQSLFIYSTTVFWNIASILFYLSGIFFLSLLLPELSIEEAERFWPLNLVCNILKNILFTIAFSMKNAPSETILFSKNQIV